jgi:Sigma-70 region 2
MPFPARARISGTLAPRKPLELAPKLNLRRHRGRIWVFRYLQPIRLATSGHRRSFRSGGSHGKGPKTAVTPLTDDYAILDQNQRAPTATLHRDIEALLPRLTRYARSLTRDEADADDVVQDCVARALTKIHLWKAGTDLRAWLFTILHNQHISQRRRAARAGIGVDGNECDRASTCSAHQIRARGIARTRTRHHVVVTRATQCCSSQWFDAVEL